MKERLPQESESLNWYMMNEVNKLMRSNREDGRLEVLTRPITQAASVTETSSSMDAKPVIYLS